MASSSKRKRDLPLHGSSSTGKRDLALHHSSSTGKRDLGLHDSSSTLRVSDVKEKPDSNVNENLAVGLHDSSSMGNDSSSMHRVSGSKRKLDSEVNHSDLALVLRDSSSMPRSQNLDLGLYDPSSLFRSENIGLAINDSSMWLSCGGNFSFNPVKGETVHFFPRGYFEHAGQLEHFKSSEFLNYREAVLCTVKDIAYFVEPRFEQVYAEISLKRIALKKKKRILKLQKAKQVIGAGFVFPYKQEGFCSRIIAPSHLEGRLYLPMATHENHGGVFPVHETIGSSVKLSLIDASGNAWEVVHLRDKGLKECYYLTDGWPQVCQQKEIKTGDRIFFKKSKEGIRFSIRRKENRGAIHFRRSEPFSVLTISNSVRRALDYQKFNVVCFPNWIDFVVDSSYFLRPNIRLMENDTRVMKRGNPMVEGRLTVAAKPHSKEAFTWRALQVRWDGEGLPVGVNHWEIVPI